jgi:hypothetical protein
MQVKNIILYNHKGEHRELAFKLNALNIITGKSRTGKSAIVSIIDYCMGRSTFNVFDGVNKDVISWYAVTYQFNNKQIFIAKKPPKNGKSSNSEACIHIGEKIGIPSQVQLHVNTNDDGVRSQIEKELNLKDNLTFRTESGEDAYKANLKHTKSFIFQEQGEIANKKSLFHRQDEPFMDQSIKDTFPFFLGAMSNERLYKTNLLKEKKQQLRKHESHLKQLREVISGSNEKAVQLLNEASNFGLVDQELISSELEFTKCINLLNQCAIWTPKEIQTQSRDELYLLQSNLSDLEKEQVQYKEKITQTRLFEKHHSSHTDSVIEHKARLKPIGLFDSTKGASCPICGNEDPDNSQRYSQINNSLLQVTEQLREITQSSPKLQKYLGDLSSKENEIHVKIEDHQVKIKTLIESRKDNKVIQDRNSYISRILGRISLFLESVKETEPDSKLLSEIDNLKHEINLLQEELNSESVRDRLLSALNVVGSYMGQYAKTLDLEYAESAYRLDISKLTVFADNPKGGIPMHRQGSGENWLGCHVITLLALHKYFSEQKSPVPSFLILDQPSQVHFPDLLSYKKLEGNIGEYSDIDMQEVANLFLLFYNYCETSERGFQIIVTEHANLSEEWFQSSIVEAPWRGNNALIPYAWLA